MQTDQQAWVPINDYPGDQRYDKVPGTETKSYWAEIGSSHVGWTWVIIGRDNAGNQWDEDGGTADTEAEAKAKVEAWHPDPPVVNDDVVAGEDYDPDEICHQCGYKLGGDAQLVTTNRHGTEFRCHACAMLLYNPLFGEDAVRVLLDATSGDDTAVFKVDMFKDRHDTTVAELLWHALSSAVMGAGIIVTTHEHENNQGHALQITMEDGQVFEIDQNGETK